MTEPTIPEHIEPDYDTAAEAWLAFEAISLGMEIHRRVIALAAEFNRRLTEERASA